jgi:hypothetical protein
VTAPSQGRRHGAALAANVSVRTFRGHGRGRVGSASDAEGGSLPAVPHVVYALFSDPEAADRVRAELTRGGKDGPGLDVRPHEHHLDANQLPEGATTFGRNMVVTTAISSVFFTVAGVVVGAFDLMLGVGPFMGGAIGLITGLVIGVYTAMQAGTRVAKPALLALAPRLPAGAVLLTIEVDTHREAERVIELLDERGADTTGIC